MTEPPALPAPGPPPIAAMPGASVDAVRALARASRHLERAFPELNLAHYRVLAAIASGDQRASRIAEKLALGKPTVSASVDSLCQRGLLLRAEVVGDQRAAALRLTPAGAQLLARADAAMAAWVEDVCRRTPDAARVLQSLAWVGQAIEQIAAAQHTASRKTQTGAGRASSN